MALEESLLFPDRRFSGVPIAPQEGQGSSKQLTVVPSKLCFSESIPTPLHFQNTASPSTQV